MTNNLNSIPVSRERIVSLAHAAFEGATRVGALVGLLHNPAASIDADIKMLVGAPAVPPVVASPGVQGILERTQGQVRQARQDYDGSLLAGRVIAGMAIDSFKPALGRRYGLSWQDAGFGRGSLQIPADPTTLLIEIRSFLISNPSRENVGDGITVTAIESARLAIQQKRGAYDVLRAAVVTARQDRDIALKQLRNRLIGLRAELDQLLDDDDENWLVFGFRRPSEGRLPQPVTSLILAPGAAGQIVASWNRAPRAQSYRVTRQLTGDAEAVDLGLFSDLAAVISGLPSGTTVIVRVAARNAAGESEATVETLVVP